MISRTKLMLLTVITGFILSAQVGYAEPAPQFVIPVQMEKIQKPVSSQVITDKINSWDFESKATMNGWFFAGGAGLDVNKGYAHAGNNNAWVRNTTGWNAANQWVSINSMSVNPKTTRVEYGCYANAWVRVSDTLTDGYMTIRDGDKPDGSGTILNEVKLAGNMSKGGPVIWTDQTGYKKVSFPFKWGNGDKVLFYVGLWGNGKDSWIQVDDVEVNCIATPQ